MLPQTVVPGLSDVLRLDEELVGAVADELALDVVPVEGFQDGEEGADGQVGPAGVGRGGLELGEEGGDDGLAEDGLEGYKLRGAGEVGQDVGQDGQGQGAEEGGVGGVGVRFDTTQVVGLVVGIGASLGLLDLGQNQGQDGIAGLGGLRRGTGHNLGRGAGGRGLANLLRVREGDQTLEAHKLPVDARIGQHGGSDLDGFQPGRQVGRLAAVLLVGDEAGEGRRRRKAGAVVPGGRGQVLALGRVEDGHDVPGVRRAEPVPALHLDDDAVRVRLLPAVQPDAELDVLGRDALGLGLGVVVLGADGACAEDVGDAPGDLGGVGAVGDEDGRAVEGVEVGEGLDVGIAEIPVTDREGGRRGRRRQLGGVDLHQGQLGGHRRARSLHSDSADAGHSGIRPVKTDLTELVDGRHGGDAAEGTGNVLAMVGGEIDLVEGVGELAQRRLALGQLPPPIRRLTSGCVVLRDRPLLLLLPGGRLLLLLVVVPGIVDGLFRTFAHG